MRDGSPLTVQYTVDAKLQIKLLSEASFAIGYLDCWLKDDRNEIKPERRQHVAEMVTRLELARDAVSEAMTAGVAA